MVGGSASMSNSQTEDHKRWFGLTGQQRCNMKSAGSSVAVDKKRMDAEWGYRQHPADEKTRYKKRSVM